jgi:hypothetical protein
MSIDVVYILGAGSMWANNEIKFSLRSVEMHLQDYGHIFVIGTKPHFLNSLVTEIPYKDAHKNKARNIMAKIYRAACDERISSEFMLFNDDYFLLQPFSAVNYPYYYKGTLQHAVEVNTGEYEKHCLATMEILQRSGLGTLNFDTHKPILYNKEKVKLLYSQLPHDVPFGYVAKSTYCNFYSLPGILETDCKISHPHGIERIRSLNHGRQMFSTGDRALGLPMQKYLKELYPNKSRYEL